MLETNKIFLDAYVLVNKALQRKGATYYPASVGKAYKDLFHRDSFACLSFYATDGEQYYMYFNSAYNPEINRMCFSSITIVSRENLNKGIATYESKTHIETVEDINDFVKMLEGVI